MSVLDRFSLRGRTALVTGGAGPQFGSSISEALAEAGAAVVVASRSLARCQAFAGSLQDRGLEAHALEVDIADAASIERLRDQVLTRFGQVDVLVNSAVAIKSGSLDSQTPEDWLYSAKGNMVGLIAACKAFLPQMISRRRGSIINISSIYGVVANDPTLYEDTGMKQPPDYTFVKAGMINFTRYLANYYGKFGVRANCISPGGFFNNQPEPFLRRYSKRVPVGRMLNDKDVQGAVVFLASDASEYVTGINLMVDGGWTAL
ncbi:MAG: SDR family oxidoreductase [Acidobacteria bacterium]|nr:SDR family oxidoreductase [Acidobacteriota bacterium]